MADDTQNLKDEIVMLTARAELAEEDAAEAWATCVEIHGTWAKRGGDPLFADRRTELLRRETAAIHRRNTGRAA